MNMAVAERIILGIDPGTNVMGYGLIKVVGRKVDLIAMGVIDLRRCTDVYLKLGRIHERVMGIIDSYHPDELAIEAPFCGKNVQSMLKLGRAQGVVIAAAISREVPIHEYAPLKVKQAITGNGQAGKEQVQEMVRRILQISPQNLLPYYDATDALAVAYCHYIQTGQPQVEHVNKGSSRSWVDFARKNAYRVRVGNQQSQ